jgi:hypothetical protein
MDVTRIPHLTGRARVQFPTVKNMELLSSYLM